MIHVYHHVDIDAHLTDTRHRFVLDAWSVPVSVSIRNRIWSDLSLNTYALL